MSLGTLILIDIQQGFYDPRLGARNNPHFESRVAEILDFWRTREGEVIHVQHLSRFADSALRPGQAGVEFMPVATPRGGERIYQKTVNSAFIGTGLEDYLRSRSRRQLYFAGLVTDYCVSTSVRMAKNLGFEPTVFSDATATFARVLDEDRKFSADLVHDVALASLREEFAQITTLNALRTESLKASG